METINQYEFIIFSRFDQYHIDRHPILKKIKYLFQGEDYFGICDRHAALDSKFANDYLSIVDYVNKESSIKDIPKFQTVNLYI